MRCSRRRPGRLENPENVSVERRAGRPLPARRRPRRAVGAIDALPGVGRTGRRAPAGRRCRSRSTGSSRSTASRSRSRCSCRPRCARGRAPARDQRATPPARLRGAEVARLPPAPDVRDGVRAGDDGRGRGSRRRPGRRRCARRGPLAGGGGSGRSARRGRTSRSSTLVLDRARRRSCSRTSSPRSRPGPRPAPRSPSPSAPTDRPLARRRTIRSWRRAATAVVQIRRSRAGIPTRGARRVRGSATSTGGDGARPRSRSRRAHRRDQGAGRAIRARDGSDGSSSRSSSWSSSSAPTSRCRA